MRAVTASLRHARCDCVGGLGPSYISLIGGLESYHRLEKVQQKREKGRPNSLPFRMQIPTMSITFTADACSFQHGMPSGCSSLPFSHLLRFHRLRRTRLNFLLIAVEDAWLRSPLTLATTPKPLSPRAASTSRSSLGTFEIRSRRNHKGMAKCEPSVVDSTDAYGMQWRKRWHLPIPQVLYRLPRCY